MGTEKKADTATPKPERRKFKAEVRQVLDIVINSLYTHREIFIRELVSNASDACEKMRHETLTLEGYKDEDATFEISIITDSDAHTITITDTGIGMTHDELVDNLGTIARSGTREFMEGLKEQQDIGSEIIGKFGVGFYSAFMVADKVSVKTRSSHLEGQGYEWVSTGVGEYRITPIDDQPRGTAITVHLKEDAREYEDPGRIKEILNTYSNFVPFPIMLNGERVNTVQAIWAKSPSDITDEEYTEFFRFIANTGEEPLSRLHISSDAPIQFTALMYVPSTNLEQFGLMRLKPSVNLYSRKILIQQHSDKLLPEYMRFVHGAVDSADLPLNISRETLQDNAVFRKLSSYLTKRVIRHLASESTKNTESYKKIWDTFGMFVKEGIVSHFENRKELGKLLRYGSSKSGDDEEISLDEYIGRMREDQKEIYYLNGRSREDLENGPYMDSFRSRGIEVLYLLEPVDDFVMTSLMEYDGKKLVSADSADIELPGEDTASKESAEEALSHDEMTGLTSWIKDTLGERVTEVRESKREMDRPAIVVNPEAGMTTTMRKVMTAAGRSYAGEGMKILEVNPRHPLIKTLKSLRDGSADKGFLQECANQIYDNALAEAGLLEDPRTMVERVYGIMQRALDSQQTGGEE